MTKKQVLDLDAADDNLLHINESFASKYEVKKRKEELSHLQQKYGDKLNKDEDDDDKNGESDTTTDSEAGVIEDEDGFLINSKVDAQILKTVAQIRAKDASIYDSNQRFFTDNDFSQAVQSFALESKDGGNQMGLSLKDYQKSRMLSKTKLVDGVPTAIDDEEEEEMPIKTHVQEQEELRDAFKAAAAAEEDSDEDLLTVRKKSAEEVKREEEEYRQFLLDSLSQCKDVRSNMSEWFGGDASSSQKDHADDAFLVNYILNRGWVDKSRRGQSSSGKDEEEGHSSTDEEDLEAVEAMDAFEERHNFRFEQQGGAEIVTHSRHISDSMRRSEDAEKRREARLRRKARKAEEKLQATEELKRLKNLKKAQIAERMAKIQEISGCNANGSSLDVDLDGDFDPEEHDRKMQQLFNDEYYEKEESSKDLILDMDRFSDVNDLFAESDQPSFTASPSTASTASVGKAKKVKEIKKSGEKFADYLDEYYSLDYEDLIANEIPCRFKYRSVPSTTFGLKLSEIVAADDKLLKSHASLKRLAPYRSDADLVRDNERLGHKKRLYKFRDSLHQKDVSS